MSDKLETMNQQDEQNEALESLREMNRIVWDTDWSELNDEAASEAETAYEHIAAAIDKQEGNR